MNDNVRPMRESCSSCYFARMNTDMVLSCRPSRLNVAGVPGPMGMEFKIVPHVNVDKDFWCADYRNEVSERARRALEHDVEVQELNARLLLAAKTVREHQ